MTLDFKGIVTNVLGRVTRHTMTMGSAQGKEKMSAPNRHTGSSRKPFLAFV